MIKLVTIFCMDKNGGTDKGDFMLDPADITLHLDLGFAEAFGMNPLKIDITTICGAGHPQGTRTLLDYTNKVWIGLVASGVTPDASDFIYLNSEHLEHLVVGASAFPPEFVETLFKEQPHIKVTLVKYKSVSPPRFFMENIEEFHWSVHAKNTEI